MAVPWSQIAFWAAVLNGGVIFGITLPNMFAAIRERRIAVRVRMNLVAYEQELRERGVTLPERCIHCWQKLPGHVAGCFMRDVYEDFGRFLEWMTRPPIRYDPPQPKAEIIVVPPHERTGT
jgi:hypothetical protein